MPEDGRESVSAETDSPETGRKESEPATSDRGPQFSFSLPPITLPPLFPDHLEIRLPVPGFRYASRLSSGRVLLVVLVFDLLDATLALAGGTAAVGPVDWVRTLGGFVLGLIVARGVGLFYAWEVLAVLAGVTWVTVAPSLSGVLLLWLWWQKDGQAESET